MPTHKALIVVVTALLATTTVTDADTLGLVPVSVPGYPAPLSAELSDSDLINGLGVPGGWSGRVWIDDATDRYVYAAVMDWWTFPEATAQLTEAKHSSGMAVAVGEEGYLGEDPSILGDMAFRILTFRRGPYLVVVGSGILDTTAVPPPTSEVMNLGLAIDANMGGPGVTTGARNDGQYDARSSRRGREPSTTAREQDASRALSGKVRVKPSKSVVDPMEQVATLSGYCTASKTEPPADLEIFRRQLRPPDESNGPLPARGTATLLKDGVVNGSATLEFASTVVDDCTVGNMCPDGLTRCKLHRVAIRLVEITVGADDGDGGLKGDGDMTVAYNVNLYFPCNGVPLPDSIPGTTEEVGDIGENGRKSLSKPLRTVHGCQCPDANGKVVPKAFFEILVRDTDDGDAVDVALPVVTGIVKWASGGVAADEVASSINAGRGKGQDTTGPDPFILLRASEGADIGSGEAEINSNPQP